MNHILTKKMLTLKAVQKLEELNRLDKEAIRTVFRSTPEELVSLLKYLDLISNTIKRPFPVPDSSVAGPIVLAYAENGQPIGFFPHECHILLAGMTGMGKTTLLRLAFSQALPQGIIIWIFARAGDLRCLRDLDPNILYVNFDGSIKINPLNPGEISAADYANIFMDIFVQAVRIYDGTKSFVLELINKLYQRLNMHGKYPSLHDLYEEVKTKKIPGFRTQAYRESALNRLGPIVTGTLANIIDCSRGHEDSLLNRSCVFEIDSLTSEQQILIVNLMLTKLFYHRIKNQPDNWMFVGIDDGNLIFDASLERRPDLGLPIIHHLTSTVRKSKINIIPCTQNPNQMGSSIHSNSSIKVMFNLVNGQDVDFMQRSMGTLSMEQKEFCYSLGPGQIVVKNSFRYPSPVFGLVPNIPPARFVSDSEVCEHNKILLSALPPIDPAYSSQESQKSDSSSICEPTRSPEKIINDNLKQLLMAVHLHQYKKTLTEIIKEAGLSAGTGSRIAKQCEKNGLIKSIQVSFKRGRPKYPILQKEAYEILGMQEKKPYGKGAGPLHILCQHLIADRLKKFKPVIELNRKDKFMDVAIETSERLLAIEVAMTAKNEKENIEKDLTQARADYVIVACKDAKTLEKVNGIISRMPPKFKTKSQAVTISDLLKQGSEDLIDSLTKGARL